MSLYANEGGTLKDIVPIPTTPTSTGITLALLNSYTTGSDHVTRTYTLPKQVNQYFGFLVVPYYVSSQSGKWSISQIAPSDILTAATYHRVPLIVSTSSGTIQIYDTLTISKTTGTAKTLAMTISYGDSGESTRIGYNVYGIIK